MSPALAPMLATPASSLRRLPPGQWRLEPKLDGWRALVAVDDGRLVIRSRSGRDLSPTLPELAHPPATLVGRQVVLDGELVVGAGTASDFYRLGPRLARGSRTADQGVPVSFIAFDVLRLDGADLCSRPYEQRRAALESLALADVRWGTTESLQADPIKALKACEALDIEGLVAKRQDGRYLPGRRTNDWIKFKTTTWRAYHAARRHEA